MICNLCPRECNIDRTLQKSFCGANTLKIAKVMKHFWEEPLISGTKGSGAVFFCFCSLKCIYCQNYEISHLGMGKEISVETLVSLFKQIEKSGAHNINLVSPTHYTEQIIDALNIYRPNIPIVWNTSGYESSETITRLKNYVDIYLCDFKYFDNNIAKEYSLATDYKEKCTQALLQMRENQPKDVICDGIMSKGLIVRHLLLPTHQEDSKKILGWVAENLGTKTIISLMSQYLPCYKAKDHEVLKRKIRPIEYKAVLNKFLALGFENGYSQEYTSAVCDFVPDFNNKDDEFDY